MSPARGKATASTASAGWQLSRLLPRLSVLLAPITLLAVFRHAGTPHSATPSSRRSAPVQPLSPSTLPHEGSSAAGLISPSSAGARRGAARLLLRDSAAELRAACRGRRIFTLPLPPRFNVDLGYSASRDADWHKEWYTYDMLEHLQKMTHNLGYGKSVAVPEDLGLPPEVRGAWFQTDQNALEVLFYERMRTYRCRVEDYNEADLVYVPYFGGSDSLRHMHMDTAARDALPLQLVEAMRGHPAWAQRNGSDHFLVLGRNLWDFFRQDGGTWGSRLLALDGVRANVLAVVVETHPGVPAVVSVPKPTSFHPETREQLGKWQEFVRGQKRGSLFAFVGGMRGKETEEGNLREKLFWQCGGATSCQVVNCSVINQQWERCMDMKQYFPVYLNATFCLHPKGDACSRRSVLDAAIAGCIPVVFRRCTLEDQFEWHLGRDKGRMFVHIEEEDVKGPAGLNTSAYPQLARGKTMIEDVLSAIPQQEVDAMRENVINAIPHMVYAGPIRRGSLEPPDFEDAVDVIINGLVRSMSKNSAVQ